MKRETAVPQASSVSHAPADAVGLIGWTYGHAGGSLLFAASVLVASLSGRTGAAGIPAVAAPAAVALLGSVSMTTLHRILRPRTRRTADRLTTLRAVLVTSAALVESLRMIADHSPGPAAVIPAILAATAAVTDYFDGLAARRWGPSETGARWDMEVDAYEMFVLSVLLVGSRGLPSWILLTGAMRYISVFGFRLLPELPRGSGGKSFRFYAKTACAVAVTVLVVSLVPGIPRAPLLRANAVAAAAIVVSFGWEAGLRMGLRLERKGHSG